MKSRLKEKTRLLLSICIFILFIAVGFTSAIGQTLSNEQISELYESNKINYIEQPALPGFFYKIFNNDWNYWTNSPNMYSIPLGNIGIGTTNPTEKLDVSGTIKMTGFKLPTGAANGYVLTSDGTGTGTWQYLSTSDGHSLDAVDGDPQNVIFIDEDGTVTINTMGTFLKNLGEVRKDPPNINIETEGSSTTTIGTDSSTSIGRDMNVDVGNNLDVNVGGDTTINSGRTLTVTSGAGITFVGSVTIDGKLTATGGVDPPYISFSKETHESIREYAKYVEGHEEVMQFWNGDFHRMEVYVISEDRFYTITGELIEG